MSIESWDVDQAVVRGPLDEELEGRCAFDRYGVTGGEEIAGEPLDVALAQEEADEDARLAGLDDPWLFVDTDGADRASAAVDGNGPEADAMHVATP